MFWPYYALLFVDNIGNIHSKTEAPTLRSIRPVINEIQTLCLFKENNFIKRLNPIFGGNNIA